MKSLENKFLKIETHEFSGLLNLGSSLEPVCRAAREEPAVQDLWHELTSEEARLELFGRIVDLCHFETDVHYENSYDAALAVYLWLLTLSDPAAGTPQSLGRLAAWIILGTPRLWWADILARREDERRNFLNGAGSHVVVAANTLVLSSINSWHTNEGGSFSCVTPYAGHVANQDMLFANVTRNLEPVLTTPSIATHVRPNCTVVFGSSPAPS